jgi:hypothetical protein
MRTMLAALSLVALTLGTASAAQRPASGTLRIVVHDPSGR